MTDDGAKTISLTPKAAEKLKEVLAKKGTPGGCLRVRVTPGGCSGLNAELDIIDAPAAEDLVFESHGARLAVDPRSELFLKGSTIDFHWTLMKSGFVVNNPNATSSCSCGVSFSV